MEPRTRPSTATEAPVTRWSSARKGQDAAEAASDVELEEEDSALPALDFAGFAGAADSELESDEPESPAEPLSLSDVAVDLPRESVAYQPEPLNTIRGALRTRLAMPLPHSSQVCSMGAEKLSRSS